MMLLSGMSSLSHAQNLKMCGQGTLFVGKKAVGESRYFAERCGANWQNQNIQMEFSYRENIPEWAFKRAANHFLKRNLSNQNLMSVYRSFTDLYQPVKAGDVYQLKYNHAQQRLSVYLNEKSLGQLQHPEAQQYFKIWLGAEPFNAKLKQQLLN